MLVRNITDPVEKIVAQALDQRGIPFIHESEEPTQRLDFWIPEFAIYVECKAFSTPRTSKQIEDRAVILIQTTRAAQTFLQMLSTNNS
jgi:hypothetical protein